MAQEISHSTCYTGWQEGSQHTLMDRQQHNPGRFRTLAHLSDLHLGRSDKHFQTAKALRDAVETMRVDRVIVTGDLTESGRDAEFAQFNELFGSLRDSGRLVVVPGNHDRLGDEVARHMMADRVDVVREDGLMIVRVDSTAAHNRWLIASHGDLDQQVISWVEKELDAARPDDLVIVMMHHHLLPLPEEYIAEKICAWLKLPFAAELRLGRTLLESLVGRCDLVLHGHRHVPKEMSHSREGRGLRIYNAGSSTTLGRFRLFSFVDGRLINDPVWVETV